MGLDNIPHSYPCKLQNSAVLNENGQIDCNATQNAKGCPWLEEKNNDLRVANAGSTYGILGTDCWYRGKYGNYLLDKMKQYSSNFDDEMDYDFYGDLNYSDEEEGISPEACISMSETMFNYSEVWIKIVDDMIEKNEVDAENRESIIYDWVYAAWWLNFAGEYCEGSGVWY